MLKKNLKDTAEEITDLLLPDIGDPKAEDISKAAGLAMDINDTCHDKVVLFLTKEQANKILSKYESHKTVCLYNIENHKKNLAVMDDDNPDHVWWKDKVLEKLARAETGVKESNEIIALIEQAKN